MHSSHWLFTILVQVIPLILPIRDEGTEALGGQVVKRSMCCTGQWAHWPPHSPGNGPEMPLEVTFPLLTGLIYLAQDPSDTFPLTPFPLQTPGFSSQTPPTSRQGLAGRGRGTPEASYLNHPMDLPRMCSPLENQLRGCHSQQFQK